MKRQREWQPEWIGSRGKHEHSQLKKRKRRFGDNDYAGTGLGGAYGDDFGGPYHGEGFKEIIERVAKFFTKKPPTVEEQKEQWRKKNLDIYRNSYDAQIERGEKPGLSSMFRKVTGLDRPVAFQPLLTDEQLRRHEARASESIKAYEEQMARRRRGEGYRGYQGSGLKEVLSWFKRAGQKVKEVGSKAANAYTSNTGVAVRNVLEKLYNPEATPNYPGEKHAILKLPSGKFQTAQYIGPGTNLMTRLRLGNKGLTDSDRVAMMHDIEYTLAQYAGSAEEQRAMGRAADLRMIASLDKIDREGRDDPFNSKIARAAIHWKTVGEDVGIMNPHEFLGPLLPPDPETVAYLKQKHGELEKIGYGIGRIGLAQRIGSGHHYTGRLQLGQIAHYQPL